MNDLIRFMFNNGISAVAAIGIIFTVVMYAGICFCVFMVTLLRPKESTLDPEDIKR